MLLVLLVLVIAFEWLDAVMFDGIFPFPRLDNRQLTAPNIPTVEMEALNDLYVATNGTGWDCCRPNTTSWNFTNPSANPCVEGWIGVNCSLPSPYDTFYVTVLDLGNLNLCGTIPSTLESLSLLEYLNLQENSLSNSIPLQLGYITALSLLVLQSNVLSGTIPGSLSHLSLLQELSLDANNIHGSIPSSFGNLTSLQFIAIGQNNLTGTMPAELLRLSLLRVVSFGHNRLQGSIPPEVGMNWSSLERFDLQENSFSGTLPSTIGLLSSLIALNLNFNAFTGTVPTTFGNLSVLQDLDISINHLTSTIPYELGFLAELGSLNVEVNSFIGTIPPAIGKLTKLGTFFAVMNHLTGTIPSEIGNLLDLEALYLADNSLTGTVPASLGKLSSLLYLFIRINFLSGPLPSEVGQLGNIQYFIVSNNSFTGSLPHSLSNFSSLIQFFVQYNEFTGSLGGLFNSSVQSGLNSIQINNNQLTGTLPEEIFQLPLLNTFVAVSNCFHGTLPSTVCNSSNMNSLILDGLSSATSCRNALFPGLSSAYTLSSKSVNGPIPSCLFELPNIMAIHLSGNDFTGSLPDLAISSTLDNFVVSHNRIDGDIKKNIQERQWYNLDLSYNRISGTLLSNYSFQDENSTLSLENNRISGYIPNALHQMNNISVLGSNLFQCKLDGSDLPVHDQDKSNYECGSVLFDLSYYLWLALGFTCIAVVAVCWFFRETLKDRFEVDLMLEQVYVWLRVTDHTAPNVHHTFAAVGHVMSSPITLYCSIFIVVVLLPVYAVLSAFYGTYTYEYAYAVSAAYLSGWVPLGVEVTLWPMLMMLFCVLFHRLLNTLKSHNEQDVMRGGVANARRFSRMQKNGIYAIYILVNVIVVGGVNTIFVVVVINGSSALLVLSQILLSIFKIVWNQACVFALLRRSVNMVVPVVGVKRGYEMYFANLQNGVGMLNNIVIPLVVVSGISRNCFYNAFVPAPPVTSSFTNTQCLLTVEAHPKCAVTIDFPDTTSYSAPFEYTYQCSSSFVTYYAPTFVSLCVISSFLVPLGKVLLLHLHKRAAVGTLWYCLLDAILPQLLRPLPTVNTNNDHNKEVSASSDGIDNRSDKDGVIFNGNRILVAISTNMGLLLTFGVVFPPLGLAFAVTILIIVLSLRIELGRLVTIAENEGRYAFIDIIAADCRVVASIAMLRNLMWMLITVGCLFYSVFLVDTTGDALGEASFAFFLIGPCLPLFLYCIYRSFLRKRSSASEDESSVFEVDSEAGSETSALPCHPADVSKAGCRMSSFEITKGHNVVKNPLTRIS